MNPFRPLRVRQLLAAGTLLVAVGATGMIPCRLVASRALADEPPKSDQAENDAQPAPVEKTASSPRPGAKAISFERESAPLTTGPMEVWALAFSAHDEFLAASGGGLWDNQDPGLVRVWDFGKSREVASYSTPRGAHSVALSPDGRRVVWGSWSGDMWLREVGGPELLHEKFQAPLRVAFSPDGKLLVGATERSQLRTWDALTGKLLEKENDATGKPIENPNGAFRGGTFPFFWVGFSPDGKYLVASGGKETEAAGPKVAVWDVATRKELYKLSDDPQRVYWAAVSPDSRTLATSGGNSIVLWDLATGVRRAQTEALSSPIYRVEFSPDGSLMASAGALENDGAAVTLWNPSTGKVVGTLTGHRLDVRALAFTHDSKTLATGSADRSVRLWNVATRKQSGVLQESKTPPEVYGAAPAILAVAWSPDGNNVATASDDGEVSIYSLSPPGPLRSWSAHADAAAALAWSPDGKMLVTGGYDKLVKIWNPATGELVRSLGGHTSWVLALAFSFDGQTLASGSYDRSIRLWNVADGQQRRTLAGHTATVRSLAFSHNDKLLASGSSDNTVRLWDPASGQQQASLAGHQRAVRSVAFSADDRLLASGGEDQAIKLWNVDSHELGGTLTGHTDMVSAVAFAQETLVSTSWDRSVRVWDVAALESRDKLAAGPTAVVALAVAPDGSRLLTAGADQSLSLWKSRVIEEPPAVALDPKGAAAGIRDDFSGKYSLNWKIIREDKSHLSLTDNPGRLTIKTQRGAIHANSGNDNVNEAAKNIFLIRNPLAEAGDFSITLAVTKFEPTTFFQQVALLCYDDDDNYLKWSYEYSWAKPVTNFVLVRETEMQPEHDLVVELPTYERFWMRVTKRGERYECAYSTDGKDFHVAGSRPWGKRPPKYLGFMAKNGGNPAADEIDVCIDSFEFSPPPRADDKRP